MYGWGELKFKFFQLFIYYNIVLNDEFDGLKIGFDIVLTRNLHLEKKGFKIWEIKFFEFLVLFQES